MPKLPLVSARKVIKVLNKLGFRIVRQSGSHIHMIGLDKKTLVTVPNHPELAKKTLASIIRQSKVEVNLFLKLLK